MEIIKTICWIVQIISAISIIVLVLLQHGKGADAGATFGSGSGSSGSLFGSTGSANFLSRTTAIFATIFFVTTFGLVLLSTNSHGGGAGVMSGLNGKVVASGVTGVSANSTKSTASGVTSKSSASAGASSGTIKGKAKNEIPG